MIDLRNIENIYLVPGYTDMRKQVDGLLSILSVKYPNTLIKPNQLYIFCGRSRTIIKVVEVDGSGVWVYYKRLNGDKFLWPKENDISLIDKRQLNNIEAKGKNDILKFFISGLYTKHDVWKYEDEWRSIIPVKQGNRYIQLGKISALYLGNKMEEATTNMIINLINKSNNGLDEISIFKMVNDISDYKLNPVQIK